MTIYVRGARQGGRDWLDLLRLAMRTAYEIISTKVLSDILKLECKGRPCH